MKSTSYILAMLLCLFIANVSGAADGANASARPGRVNFNPDHLAASGEILVKFKSGMLQGNITEINEVVQTPQNSVNAIFSELLVSSMQPVFQNPRQSSLSDIYRLRFGAPVLLLAALERMAKDPSVEWAEPNYLYEVTATPNDP